MKGECIKCGTKKNIITNLYNKRTKEFKGICVTHFNQAARCEDGLLLNGERFFINLPRVIYGRDWVYTN